MCRGTDSLGNATIPSGNSGKPLDSRSGILRSLGALVGAFVLRCRAARLCAAALARGEHEVVEDRRGKPRLEQPAVELLQEQVAAVGVQSPPPRHVLRLGGRLERALGPTEPVGQQLLPGDALVLEAGGAGLQDVRVTGEELLANW